MDGSMNTATNSPRTIAASGRADAATPSRRQRQLGRFSSKNRQAPASVPAPANVRQLKPDSASLNELIRRAQQGDAEAFEAIYRLHSQRVYALCLRMLGNSTEAEDLAQEAFLQLFRKIHTFRGESAFSSWLHRLTANVVLMSFRKKRPIATSLDEVSRVDEDSDLPRKEIGVTDLQLSGVFDRVNLQAAIAQLPEGYKSMFILHDLHGYEHNEIAEILGCSVGNSKSQLHKARKRLRELLHRVQHYRTHQAREAAGSSLTLAASY
jgi:RNA polymerase sigma-70 factor (ECF subfamily)